VAHAAILVVALIVLVGLGYIAGRTVQLGDQRFTYLAVGTFIAVIVGALGLITALDGVVAIAVPQKIASSGGRGGVVRTIELPAPALTDDGGTPGQMQVPPNLKRLRDGLAMRLGGGERSTHGVRDGGIVRLFRGLVLIVGAGAFLFAYRRLMPAVAEPAEEPSPTARRRTRRAAE
jgi:hypothetical protein